MSLNPHPDSKYRLALYCAYFVIIAATLYLYSPALHHNYVWDDATMVFKRGDFLRDNWLTYLLTEPFFIAPNYYRPLATLALYLDFRLGSANPAISHGVNLVIFLCNLIVMALLLQAVAKKLHLSARESLLICSVTLLFYSLHTSLTESVIWVSGRFDLLVTSFILLAFLCDTIAHTTRARAITVATCFLLAALCKEMAVVFLPALILWHFLLSHATSHTRLPGYLQSPALRSHLPVYLAIIAAGLFYLVLRYLALGYLLTPTPTDHLYGTPANRLATVLKAIFLYWQMLLFPFLRPSILYPENYPVAADDPQALFGLLLLCFIPLLALLRHQRGVQAALLVFLIFLVSILPIIHIATMTIGDNIVHQRFLAVPLSLFVLTLLPLYRILKGSISRLFTLFLSAAAVGYLVISLVTLHSIVPLWNNNVSLWGWTYRIHGNDTAALNLADAVFARGHFQEAYDLAKSVKKPNSTSILRMAEAALALRHFEEAKTLFQTAIDSPDMLETNKPTAYANIAYLKILTNDLDRVDELLELSLQLRPTASRTHFYYALYYYKKADFPNAHRWLDNAIKYSLGEPQYQASYRDFHQKFIDGEAEYRKSGTLPRLFSDE